MEEKVKIVHLTKIELSKIRIGFYQSKKLFVAFLSYIRRIADDDIKSRVGTFEDFGEHHALVEEADVEFGPFGEGLALIVQLPSQGATDVTHALLFGR